MLGSGNAEVLKPRIEKGLGLRIERGFSVGVQGIAWLSPGQKAGAAAISALLKQRQAKAGCCRVKSRSDLEEGDIMESWNLPHEAHETDVEMLWAAACSTGATQRGSSSIMGANRTIRQRVTLIYFDCYQSITCCGRRRRECRDTKATGAFSMIFT